jgi:factor associated with neutral sphingomyelinase activation
MEPTNRDRFSLLLLEPGEIYFEDFSAVYHTVGVDADGTGQKGRFKLCSKSVVFEPHSVESPLVRIPLKSCASVADGKDVVSSGGKAALVIDSDLSIEMLAKNVPAPYVFRKLLRRHVFEFTFAKLESCLPKLCQLHRAAVFLSPVEQSTMVSIQIFFWKWQVNVHDSI